MEGMGIHTMGMAADIMVEGIMEVVATIVPLTTDLQTDPIDQDLKTLLQDRIDQRPNHPDLLVSDLLPDHQDQCQVDQWVDHQVCLDVDNRSGKYR